MKHLIQPNRWSCLPTSFAMACDVSLKKILEIIGHAGDDIIWPGLPEPQRRRTFHIQECIWAAYKLGFAVTAFELAPQLATTPDCVINVPINYNPFSLLKGCGVATGYTPRNRHAIAFEKGIGYDPNGTIIDFEITDFTLEVIYKIDLIS